MTKCKIHLTVLNEDGEEEVVEVDCFSADQAVFLSEGNGTGTIVGVEKAVMRAVSV